MLLEENAFFSKIKYIFYLIARAFLIAIICSLALVFLILIIYFGDLLINVRSGNYSSPLFNGYVIVSKSMVPTINVNDAIVVKRDNKGNYGIGDIISFFSTEYRKSGMVVTHRIIDKSGKTYKKSVYTTKGDNNIHPDKNLTYTDNIYGKVMFVIPKLGYVQKFISNPINFICCVLFPALAIILIDFLKVGILFKQNDGRNYS